MGQGTLMARSRGEGILLSQGLLGAWCQLTGCSVEQNQPGPSPRGGDRLQ